LPQPRRAPREIPIDISSLANEPWTYLGPNDFLIINGDTFPTGSQNFGGVPFAIPTGPNNYWAGAAAANFGPGVVRLTIPVGVSASLLPFTLLNSMWGLGRSDGLSVYHFHRQRRRDRYPTAGGKRECTRLQQ
jgi:hypothetical protein